MDYELNLHNGKVIVLGADQIKAMEAQPSMMPDNLLAMDRSTSARHVFFSDEKRIMHALQLEYLPG